MQNESVGRSRHCHEAGCGRASADPGHLWDPETCPNDEVTTLNPAPEPHPGAPVLPDTVSETAFWTAAKPLFDLLGITPMHIYGGLAFSRDEGDNRVRVRYTGVLTDDAEEAQPATGWLRRTTGDGPYDEWAYDAEVTVMPADGEGNVVQQLWSDQYPKASLARESGV